MTDWREDNPAGRLHIIFERLRGVGAGDQIRHGWVHALDVQGAPDVVIFRGIAETAMLIEEAEDAVLSLDESVAARDLFLAWAHPARNVMASAGRFQEQLIHIYNAMSDAQMVSLLHCAHLLHTHSPSPMLDKDRLDNLIDLVREAIDGISSDENLSPATRLYLVSRLREVEWALQNVGITGYDGVNAAMDAFTGGVVTTPEAAESENARSWWRKVWEGFNAACTGVQQIAGTQEAVVKMIESAGGGA